MPEGKGVAVVDLLNMCCLFLYLHFPLKSVYVCVTHVCLLLYSFRHCILPLVCVSLYVSMHVCVCVCVSVCVCAFVE